MKATNARSVYSKLEESRFFLNQMMERANADPPNEFLYCVSGFLQAFRSAVCKLYGYAEMRRDKPATKMLKQQLENHPQIKFFRDLRNMEVHGDGATLFRRYNLHIADSMHRWGSQRWEKRGDRWTTVLTDHYPVPSAVVVEDWHFEGNSTNLIVLCHDALNELENIVRQNIQLTAAVTQSSTQS